MSKRRTSRAPAINSVGYWDQRFQGDWDNRGGPEQTRFFARVFSDALPAWLTRRWSDDAFSLMDVGCAQGDASEILTTRFPKMHFIGVDISAVGIEQAEAAYPFAEFKRIEPDWSDLPVADFLLCSNTIEHLTDWRARLVILCKVASHAAFVLVPYCEAELEAEHVARFDERAFPISIEDKRLVFMRVVDTAHIPNSRWSGRQMLAIYALPDLAPRGRGKRTRGDLHSGLDLRGASDEEVVQLLMQMSQTPVTPSTNASDVPSDVEKVNQSWKAKFEEMVASFDERHQQTLADHQQEVVALQEQIHASALESQATFKRLSDERDAANVRSDIAERRLAFNEEMNSIKLAHAEDVGRREMALEKSALEMAFAKENFEREREIQRLKSEVNQLRAEAQAAEKQHVDDVSQQYTDLIKAREDELDGLSSAHAAEVGRLTANITELDATLRRFQGERAKEVSSLEAERERLAGVLERATQESRRLLSERERLFGSDEEDRRLLAERTQSQAYESLNVENDNLRRMLDVEVEKSRHCDQMLRMQRRHYEAHLDSMNRELDRLSSEVVELIERALEENNRQADMLWAAASHNTRIASVLADNSTDGGRNGALAHALQRMAGLFRRKQNVASEVVVPLPAVPLPTRLQPTMRMITHLLDAFKYERNFAGATKDDVETPEGAPAESEIDPQRTSDGIVIAMQLEAFDRGGLERVVFDLCSGISAAGVPVLILCRSAGNLADEISRKNIKLVVFGSDAAYEAALRDNHVTHLFLHHSYTGTDIASRLGVEIFDVVHNTYFWKIGHPGPVRKVGQSAAAVICVSSRVRDFHVRAFDIPEAKTRLINNPINTEGLIIPETGQLRQIRSSSNQTTFLNVANFYPAKAQVALISAFAQAYRVRPEIRLLIAGAESTPAIADKVRLLIRQHGLQDAVTLLGHCTREDLSRHYTESHGFLLPSIYEGYSVSAIEAATFGLPLIMTDVGGARDLICDGDCGILLPPIVDDLARYTPEIIAEIGVMSENAATPSLTEALITVARDRDSWLERGFTAMGKPRSLPSVVADYLDLVGHRGGPEVSPAVRALEMT